MQNIIQRVTRNQLSLKIFGGIRDFALDNSFLLITMFLIFLKTMFLISYVSSPTGTYLVFFGMPIYIMNFIFHFAFIAVTVSIAYVFRGKLQIFMLIFINLALSTFLFFDLLYYRGFQSFLSIYNLFQSSNLDDLSSSIISMMRPTDVVFFIDIVILLFLRKKYFYIKAQRKIKLFLILFIVGSLLPVYYHYRYDILDHGKHKTFFHLYYSPRLNMANMSPIGYHIYDTYLYFENSKRLVLSDKDKSEIKDWYAAKASAEQKLPDNDYKGIFKGKNLIVLQVESLENFVIDQKINGQEITPRLNKLLNNSIYYPNIYEQVSGGNSSDADLLTITSTYPVRSGATFFRFPDNKYNSLPVLMKKRGYYSSAFHADGGGYWNWSPAMQSIGFDKVVDVTGFKIDELIGLGLSDGSFFRQLSDKLEKQQQPFYSFAVTLTSHMPFIMPDSTKQLKLPGYIANSKLGDYFQAISYVDKSIGDFIDSLDKKGLLDNSAVVIFGDHTGVHKYYKDKLTEIQPQEQWWAEDNLRVPLIIYSKDLKGNKFDTIGGQVDVMPTVAYLMGVDEKEYLNTAMGRNLLKTDKSFTVLSNGKYIGDYKNEEEKNMVIKGLDLSDKMLRNNYFKDNK